MQRRVAQVIELLDAALNAIMSVRFPWLTVMNSTLTAAVRHSVTSAAEPAIVVDVIRLK